METNAPEGEKLKIAGAYRVELSGVHRDHLGLMGPAMIDFEVWTRDVSRAESFCKLGEEFGLRLERVFYLEADLLPHVKAALGEP